MVSGDGRFITQILCLSSSKFGGASDGHDVSGDAYTLEDYYLLGYETVQNGINLSTFHRI